MNENLLNSIIGIVGRKTGKTVYGEDLISKLDIDSIGFVEILMEIEGENNITFESDIIIKSECYDIYSLAKRVENFLNER